MGISTCMTMRTVPASVDARATASAQAPVTPRSMRRAAMVAAALCAAATAAPPAGADEFTQHAAHVHGRATLDVAVDGGRVDIRFDSPAIDVLGFEHAPRTAAERQAVRDAAALLGAHANAFAFPVAARCTATSSKLEAPDWKTEHADYEAQWTFTCAAPAALAFVDATFVAKLRPGTAVDANVIAESLQNRQPLRAGAVRVKLR